MEAAVEVATLSAVAVGRLMGSQEGFGSGTGGVVVGEVRWRSEGACSSVGRKDDIIAANVSVPSFWHKVPDPEHHLGISQPSSLCSHDVYTGRDLGNLISEPPRLEVDVKCLTQKSGKIERKNGGYIKRSTMAQMECSKSKLGYGVNGVSPELVASSSASFNTSEKSQIAKQNNSSSGSRRGDKRTSRLKQKSRCDAFSLKSGLVGFNSAGGGNNFLGMYGLKPDAIDITKFVSELPLHDLLSGNYSSPCISKDKGKKSASSNNDLMQSVRKACSILQTRRGLQIQNSAEMDNSCNRSDSTSLITVNSAVGQSDVDKEDNRTDLLSSGEVQESYAKIRKSSLADSPLYTPNDVFERLALPLPKNLDLLLSDLSKTTSKICADPRIGKSAPHRTGLPPFPWSHSFSGNTKLGSDAVKVSASRTTCQGRWVKVKNPIALQKGSVNLLADFESVVFDKSLVPSDNPLSGKQENVFTPTERALSVSGACSTSKVAADECSSSIHIAAQTLIDMGAYSKENPSAVVKLLKKPSRITMKATKSKAIKRCDFVDVPNSKIRPTNSLKASDGFPSKKLRLSKDAFISHTEVPRQGKSHQFEIRSPPRKAFRDSNANTDSYGTNLVKKSSVLKTPRSIDRSSSSKPKFWKPSQ